MKRLVIDNLILYTEEFEYHSGNVSLACRRLEQNKRIVRIQDGNLKRDMAWFMKILPQIAEYFSVGRIELLGWWMQDYGLAEFIKMADQKKFPMPGGEYICPMGNKDRNRGCQLTGVPA